MPTPLQRLPSAPMRVLVVDDDREVRTTLEVVLSAHGYHILTAADGSEGLMRAERDAPHLILIDLMMPRRSGLSVVEHLERWPSRPRIILMTASTESRHQQLSSTARIDGFLRKPFELPSLLALVDGILSPLADRFAAAPGPHHLQPRVKEESATTAP